MPQVDPTEVKQRKKIEKPTAVTKLNFQEKIFESIEVASGSMAESSGFASPGAGGPIVGEVGQWFSDARKNKKRN